MDYTEEELSKECEGVQKKELQEENVEVGNTVFSTFMKTFGFLICAVFYVLAIAVCIMPKTSSKFYELFDSKNAVVVCYEKIYEKSGQNADLYNLILKSIDAKNHKLTAKYIKELREKDNYIEFCDEVNSASVSATENKYIAYVADLDGYLVSQRIVALYSKGSKKTAENEAINDIVYNENIYSFGISAYVDCLMNDENFTEQEKNQKLIDFYEKVIDVNDSQKEISTYIEEKRTEVDLSNAVGNDKVDKILRVYTSLKIDNIKLLYYEATANETEANAMRLQIEELQDIYADLIK